MACSGVCGFTRYEVEHNLINDPITEASCTGVDVKAAIARHMAAAFPEESGGCGDGCSCLELPDQNPVPTKWSPQYVRKVQFRVPETECTIYYEATYRYRVRHYVGNCARGPIPPGQ
jgi:hypothetical protein